MAARKWTKEALAEEARKYGTLGEFKSNSNSAYLMALRSGVIEEITGHMHRVRRHNWTAEEIAREAKKYSSRNEFHDKALGAYKAAARLGMLEEACVHMGEPRQTTDWSDAMLAVEASKYLTRSDFAANSQAAYQASRWRGILDVVCAHMRKP